MIKSKTMIVCALAGVTLFGCSAGDPIRRAAENGKIATVQRMLDNGTPVNVRDHEDLTALHGAASEGEVAVAKLLLDRGADVNAKDKNGDTPLHYAARDGTLEMARLLLDHGASVTAINDDHQTALHVAADNNHPLTIDLLLAHGANPSAQDHDGQTPLQIARDQDAHEAVDRLQAYATTSPAYPMPVSTADPSKTARVNGSILQIDGVDMDTKFMGLANPDPVAVAPGVHEVKVGHKAQVAMNFYRRGFHTVILKLTFQAGQSYTFDLTTDEKRVTIKNVTTGRVVHYDLETALFFDDNRNPIPPTQEPYAP